MSDKTVIAVTLLSIAFLQSCGRGAGDPPASAAPTSDAAIEKIAVIEIPNARTPAEGLLTGGQPTREQIVEAARAGYGTIVNLRTDAEEGFEWEGDLVEELGMRYVQIPVAGTAGLTRENVELLTAALEAGGGPVMIHCASGNRVGAMMALKAAWVDDATPDEAIEIGRDFGMTRSEPAVREILADD
ncbi:MAG: protein tyrosine phosphatase family protein [Acidobacteriota bacterium]|nr:protein tyrosine phosphatase family protein [Acidobacteriota bacterium]